MMGILLLQKTGYVLQGITGTVPFSTREPVCNSSIFSFFRYQDAKIIGCVLVEKIGTVLFPVNLYFVDSHFLQKTGSVLAGKKLEPFPYTS